MKNINTNTSKDIYYKLYEDNNRLKIFYFNENCKHYNELIDHCRDSYSRVLDMSDVYKEVLDSGKDISSLKVDINNLTESEITLSSSLENDSAELNISMFDKIQSLCVSGSFNPFDLSNLTILNTADFRLKNVSGEYSSPKAKAVKVFVTDEMSIFEYNVKVNMFDTVKDKTLGFQISSDTQSVRVINVNKLTVPEDTQELYVRNINCLNLRSELETRSYSANSLSTRSVEVEHQNDKFILNCSDQFSKENFPQPISV